MTDSMNFGPDWIRNLSSEGSTGGGTSTGSRYQLADYRYGREEMLALFDRNIKPPACLTNFKSLYSETALPPLALIPPSEEERSSWQGRPITLGGPQRGRGGSLERGGRINRGRGGYQSYGRPANYEGGWGNGEPSEWSPRKEYNTPRPASMDNWRRARNIEEDDGWRMSLVGRGMHEKWGRQTSWRGETDDERTAGPPERGGRTGGWHEMNRSLRRSWENEDHLPEWANENPLETGGSFDDRGAFHGSDEEQDQKKQVNLQKSTSQQHIISHKTHPPLLTSKSTTSLVHKDVEQDLCRIENSLEIRDSPTPEDRKVPVPEVIDKSPIKDNGSKCEVGSLQNEELHEMKVQPKVEENDFEKLQEDFVSKLVVDEEPRSNPPNGQQQTNFELPSLVPPPNLPVPGQDKWFYQDPQGQMQGPFTSAEMSGWSKAGYFDKDLKVRRQCDERFFLLGELIAICGNANPFQTSVRFPVLKNDITKMPEGDLQFQYLSQLAAYKQAQARVLADPWSAIAVQQQELAAQRLIMQQQQDLQYMPPHAPPTNPLMQMISQMQQVNKLSQPNLTVDKQPPNMDPHNMHMHNMTNFLTLQSRLPGQIPAQLPPESLTAGLGAPLLNVPEHLPTDPISSLLKQLKQQNQVESLWHQNQFSGNLNNPSQQQQQQQQQQWPGQADVPLSMWDMQPQNQAAAAVPIAQSPELNQVDNLEKGKVKNQKAKENIKQKEDEKELKKKKKAEEEQQKKEAEEKRKQEQRKLETDKKAEAERKRKEEERIKKELEKAKKEAEDKRMRELEEKRRLKEQRKLEEEAKRRAEEKRRVVEEERIQREKEQREREERQKAEERRQEPMSMTKAAPWSQANSTFGMSLAEIQKAEREQKVQEAALQAQRAQIEKTVQLQLQQQQQMLDKSGGLQFGWAKKSMEPRKVKSLAEIQAEEQERLAKEAAEARLKKEKESRESVNHHQQTSNSIWSGQNLTWNSSPAQWSSSSTNISGFWDETKIKPAASVAATGVAKSNSISTITKTVAKPQQQQPVKPKPQKKEEAAKKNHNNNVEGDFTSWCYKSLANISSDVDVPTFVTFLKDIESAFEVREYCKEYLGESNSTLQFANNFLEKRRTFNKPKQLAPKDDMCAPAPAITPSMHNNTQEFQEVKGKNKKTKKSKMLKVDSRILGFNVTSAPDRINVGDRDYGDNS